MPTTDAVRKCAEWLAECRRLGWRLEDLDALEALWWKYHDERSELKPARAAETQAPTDDAALFIDTVGLAFDCALHCEHTKSANLWCYWPNSDPAKACGECQELYAAIRKYAAMAAPPRADALDTEIPE